MRAQCRAAELSLEGGPPEHAATYLLPTLPRTISSSWPRLARRQALARTGSAEGPSLTCAALPSCRQQRNEATARASLTAEARTFEIAPAADHLRDALADLGDVTPRPDLVLAYVHSLMILAERGPEAVARTADRRVRGPGARRSRRACSAAHHEPELHAIVEERWPDLLLEQEVAIRSGSFLAMGAILEGRRGVDRARAIELATRPLRSESPGPKTLYGFVAPYVLTFGREADQAAQYPDAIEGARRRGDRCRVDVAFQWALASRAG